MNERTRTTTSEAAPAGLDDLADGPPAPTPEPPRSAAARYGVAVAVAVAAVLLTILLRVYVPQLTWLLVLGAVSVAAWYGGLRPGLVAALVGGLGILWSVAAPTGSFAIRGGADLAWIALFAVVAFLVSAITGALQTDRGRLSAAAAQYRGLADRYRALVEQVQAHAASLEREVAGHRATEAQLRASEERFRHLVDGVADYGIFGIDPDGRVASWNAGAERLEGYAAEEVLGQPIARFYDPEAAAAGAPAEDLARAARDGRVEREGIRVRRDGRRFWANVVITALRRDDGTLAGYSQITRDVTERREIERELAANQARLAGIIGSAMDAIITTDASRRIVLFNAAAERMFGVAASDAIGTAVDRFVPADLRERHAGQMQRFGETGETSRHMHRPGRALAALRADGTEFPVEATISQLVVEGERYFTVILRDVGARLAAERALAASESRYRELVEEAPQLAWSRAADGTIEFCNARWHEHTGVPVADTRAWLEAVHPEDRPGVEAAHAAALRDGAPYAVEMRLRGADGAHRWFAAREVPLHGRDGAVLAWHGAALDVDEQRRRDAGERVLAAAGRVLTGSLYGPEMLRALARLVVPTLADYCVVDLVEPGDGRLRRSAVAHADPALEPLLERTARHYPSERDTHPLRVALAGGEPLLVAEVDEAWRGSAATSAEHRADIEALGARSLVMLPLVARGRTFGVIVLVHAARERGGSGRRFTPEELPLLEELARRAALAFDNARLYAAERAARAEAEQRSAQLQEQAVELEHQTDQAQTLATELEVTADELRAAVTVAEAASHAKSTFLATMSHEIRTPINAILGFNELLELGIGGPLTDAQRDFVTRVRSSGRHLLGLVDELLDLARVEAGQLQVRRDRARLAPVVSAAAELVRSQAAARRLQLELHCPDDFAFLGDEDRVRQILVNLLVNAVKFTAPGGRVALHCGQRRHDEPAGPEDEAVPGVVVAERVAYVVVTDTGIGIPADKLEAIFEPFVQVEGGYTRTRGGTGLGLAISRQLARLMGGELTVRSGMGSGSSFTLWLPGTPGIATSVASGTELPPARTPTDVAAVGELLTAGTINEIVATVVDRLRADPVTIVARDTDDRVLEDHLGTFLRDLARLLVHVGRDPLVDDAPGEPVEDAALTRDLIADGTEIQRVIAELHGAQRARLGWSAEALEREHAIVRQEMESAVRRALGSTPTGVASERSLALLRHYLQRAAAISRAGFEEARARAAQERDGG